MRLLLSSLIFVILLITTGCIRSDDCEPSFNFQVPLTLSSFDPYWQVGDTLTVSMDIDNSMIEDSRADRIVDYPAFNPLMNLSIIDIDALPVKDILDDIELIISDEHEVFITQFDSLVNALFVKEVILSENRSKLEFSFVLNKSGTFAILFIANLTDDSGDFSDKCTPRQNFSLEPASLGTTIGATFLLPDTTVVNSEILTENNQEVIAEFFANLQGGNSYKTKFYFKVE